MKKRMILTIGAMLLFLVAIGSFKFLQIRGAIAQSSSFQPPPEAVTTGLRVTFAVAAVLVVVALAIAVRQHVRISARHAP